jgi:hypothetical protein
MTEFDPAAFIATVPWRQVKQIAYTDTPVHAKPDPHEYTIRSWREVDADEFDAFCRLIRERGYRATYRAPYRPDVELQNTYLEIDGWCYWRIGKHMLNRERAEHRKHEPIPEQDEQLRLPDE